jgi:hypothetical protein
LIGFLFVAAARRAAPRVPFVPQQAVDHSPEAQGQHLVNAGFIVTHPAENGLTEPDRPNPITIEQTLRDLPK